MPLGIGFDATFMRKLDIFYNLINLFISWDYDRSSKSKELNHEMKIFDE